VPALLAYLEDKKTLLSTSKLQVAVVYIAEAHASDTWPMKWAVEWPRPVNLEQRVQYARTCVKDLQLGGMRLLVDDMDNAFNACFGAWPTSYYILHHTKLIYIGNPPPTEAFYDIHQLFDELDNLLLA